MEKKMGKETGSVCTKKYAPPELIRLGELAKGFGQCETGSGNDDCGTGNSAFACLPGNSASGVYCGGGAAPDY